MVRIGYLALFVSLAVFLTPLNSHADVISRDNPYRSFNLSGVNYGSLRWEEQHKKSKKPTTTVKPKRVFRWRAR